MESAFCSKISSLQIELQSPQIWETETMYDTKKKKAPLQMAGDVSHMGECGDRREIPLLRWLTGMREVSVATAET